MININKTLEFLNYIYEPMSKENIEFVYKLNNINYEKCELFNDFVQSLLVLIFDTYMGDEYTDTTQQINHFKWCWKKNIADFKKEGIKIGDTKTYDYFLDIMFDLYYPSIKGEQNPDLHNNIMKLWSYMFEYNFVKSKVDMDTVVTLYKLLDQSLNVEK